MVTPVASVERGQCKTERPEDFRRWPQGRINVGIHFQNTFFAERYLCVIYNKYVSNCLGGKINRWANVQAREICLWGIVCLPYNTCQGFIFLFCIVNLQFLPIFTAEYRMFRKKSVLMSVFTNHIMLCIFTYLCQWLLNSLYFKTILSEIVKQFYAF